jgi:farnesyl-diphosphate farnesyltransferase
MTMNNAQTNVAMTPDLDYQDRILQGVSRTFALTIPQLPDILARVVGNAYLLCRIVDTIEDDKRLDNDSKRRFADMFIAVVKGEQDADVFADNLAPLLEDTATVAERDLIEHTPAVIRVTHSFNQRQRAALVRCVSIMGDGMVKYQESDVRFGLSDLPAMDRYCYYVAGVVGEMLTELFCDYSAEIDSHRDELMRLAVSFGQGLQMTNILKDIWDDQERGMCWLPQDIYRHYGADLKTMSRDAITPEYQRALGHLIGVARAHLDNALRYTLIIPARETGIRRFCLWALGMAVLTLRKVNRRRDYTSGQQVKISRRSVKGTILMTNLLTRHDRALRLLFNLTARPLPEGTVSKDYAPQVQST